MIRRLLSLLFYAETTHAHHFLQLPPGIDEQAFWRLHALGYTADDALYLCDFFRLCETSLRVYDGAVAG